MNAWRFWLSQLTKRLWVRAALYGCFGVAVALVAALFSPFVPDQLAKPFGGGTVNALLNVLATSLLTVATLSVAAMLTAYTNVSQSATPRAAALITGDSRAQGALATFIGAFLYSVVAFSALGTGYYGGGGRAILFFVTLAMLGLVAITLLRWLDQLLSLARVGHAVDQVERATLSAIKGPFGAASAPEDCDPCPENSVSVFADKVGYVQNVDVPRLRRLASQANCDIWVESAPGAFVAPGRAMALVGGCTDEGILALVRRAFVIGDARSFDQDPRFGLVVLGEIASRALSPGINDPGTAIDVVGTGVRLLIQWVEIEGENRQTLDHDARDRVRLPRPAYSDLVDDVFTPLARDGAASLSVAIRVQKAFSSLAASNPPSRQADLRRAAREALERARSAMDHGSDVQRVAQAHEAGSAS